MDDDDRISSVFHRAVATIDPPVERLVAGGIARGRRRLRLVRAAEVLSVVAIVVAVGALAVALIPGSAAHHVPRPPGHDRAAATPPGPTTSAAPPPTTVTMTPQALLQTTLDLLPRPGTTRNYAGRASDGFVATEFVYDDGHGPAQVDAAFEYGPTAETIDDVCTGGVLDCRSLPDGSRLGTYQGYEYPSDPSRGAREWSVWLGRPDGLLISFSEWNSAQEKDAPISRPAPPFTIAELTAMAGSPHYALTISPERAKAAASLFMPDQLEQPDPDATGSASKSAKARLHALRKARAHLREERKRAECKLAKVRHKTPPAYC